MRSWRVVLLGTLAGMGKERGKMTAHYNRVAYKSGPLSLCSIYGHDWERLALGEIVCYRCGVVHKMHYWRDVSEGGVRMMANGPVDSIQEKVVCIICGMDKEVYDQAHALECEIDELP
jgi:hypothetical protein